MFVFPQPQYSCCSECGFVMLSRDLDGHTCDSERWLDFQILRLRPRIYAFEADLGDWLRTCEGRFASYYAKRTRPA